MHFYFLNNQTPGAAGGDFSFIIMMAVMLGVFYFMIIRPQRKKEKETKKMLNALTVGDEVITIGGIYGKIVRIKDDTLFIESTPDKTKVQIARWAVKEVTKKYEIEE